MGGCEKQRWNFGTKKRGRCEGGRESVCFLLEGERESIETSGEKRSKFLSVCTSPLSRLVGVRGCLATDGGSTSLVVAAQRGNGEYGVHV